MNKKRAGSMVAREIIQEVKDPWHWAENTLCFLQIQKLRFRDKENSCKVMMKPEDRNLQLMQLSMTTLGLGLHVEHVFGFFNQ